MVAANKQMTTSSHTENAKIFKAFADTTRLMVLSMLQSGEKCACDLLDKVSVGQSTLSHHMKILVESGIVDGRKEGKWMYYSINQKGSERAVSLLYELTKIDTENYENRERCCEWLINVVSRKAGVTQQA